MGKKRRCNQISIDFLKPFDPNTNKFHVEHINDLPNRCLPVMKTKVSKVNFANKNKPVAGNYFYYDSMKKLFEHFIKSTRAHKYDKSCEV